MSNIVEIKKENAIKAFSEGTDDVKKALKNLFGEEIFKNNRKWMELWVSFCTANSLTVSLPYPTPKNNDEESANAYIMLIHIARIRNEGWNPDWNDNNQYKYYPWFDMRSGSGFSYDDCGSDGSGSDLGSRLCFKSSSLAESVGKEFISIYEKFLTK